MVTKANFYVVYILPPQKQTEKCGCEGKEKDESKS